MIRYLEYQELLALLKEAQTHSRRAAALIGCMAYTGMRVSEVTHLHLRHVFVNNQVPRVMIVPANITKTNKEREVIIPDPLVFLLENYIPAIKKLTPPDPWLFPGTFEKPLTVRAVEIMIKTLGNKALDRRVTPHMLRHTFGTLLARSAPIRVVQEALGHRSLASTQIYTHVNRSDLQKAVTSTFPAPVQPANSCGNSLQENTEAPND